MKTIVAGGAGFIGSHLVEYLLNCGREVTIIDDFSTGRLINLPENNKNLTIIDFDISKMFEGKFLLKKLSECQVCYHLAAKPLAINTTPEEEKVMFETNVNGTYNLITHLPKSTKFVFAGTANVYSEGRNFTEQSPFKITSVYGYTKAIGERIIELSNNPYVIFRFGTVVGTRGRCFPNRLVWCAVNDVPVTIFSEGEAVRDIIDVRDVVRQLANYWGNVECLSNSVYNLGTNTEISGTDLVKLVSEIAEKRGYRLDASFVLMKPKSFVKESTLNTTPYFRPNYGIRETLLELFDYYENGGYEPPVFNKTLREEETK